MAAYARAIKPSSLSVTMILPHSQRSEFWESSYRSLFTKFGQNSTISLHIYYVTLTYRKFVTLTTPTGNFLHYAPRCLIFSNFCHPHFYQVVTVGTVSTKWTPQYPFPFQIVPYATKTRGLRPVWFSFWIWDNALEQYLTFLLLIYQNY
jgi:hypothetical protein